MQVLSANKQKKVDLAIDMSAKYSSGSNFVFLFNYSGLNACETQNIRVALRRVGGTMMVLKNTINAIALKKAGFGSLSTLVEGQLAIAFGLDCIGMAKVISEANESELIKFIAYGDGNVVYDVKSLATLAKLPSLEVLRAKLIGLLLSVPTKLVSVLLESPRSLVRVLDARANNK
ncbi:MAG: 50S ribosomal protein L10 [Alphaproteobacteria bacterium]|nr:50S ribosomal protein L10 [Rickettsiales bacterium]